MSNDSIVKFCPFDNVECCFDIVAVFGNNVAGFGNNVAGFGNNVKATFDTVERIVQIVAFDNVASTLLLVWTALNGRDAPLSAVDRDRTCTNAGDVSQI